MLRKLVVEEIEKTYYERVKREKFFFLNVYDRTFWEFIQPKLTRPSDFCEAYASESLYIYYISERIRFITSPPFHRICSKNWQMRTFLNCELSNFQSNQPNLASMKSIQTGKISNNSNKLTLVGVIYLKLCKLKFWKSRLNPLALFFFWWYFHHKKGRLKMFISQTVKD